MGATRKITIYLDHNVIDEFDKGKTAYLDLLLVDNGVWPVISAASVDEIFRGGDEARSRTNIESLKKLGVRYIHDPGPDKPHMLIDELDYERIYQKWSEAWSKKQSEVGSLNDSHFRFISAVFRGNTPEATQDMDQATDVELAWFNDNYNKLPSAQTEMGKVLRDPQQYKELSRQLLHLRELIPFTPREINNIPKRSVFWTCVGKLKSDSNPNVQVIGNFIENDIESATTIGEQFDKVFLWLNVFRYHPDDLTKKNKVQSNFSDGQHAASAIACDGLLTLDTNFAERAAAAMGALRLKVEVSTDARELLGHIAALSGHFQ